MPVEREMLKMWVREHKIYQGDWRSCEGIEWLGGHQKKIGASSVVTRSKEESNTCSSRHNMLNGVDIETVDVSS